MSLRSSPAPKQGLSSSTDNTTTNGNGAAMPRRLSSSYDNPDEGNNNDNAEVRRRRPPSPSRSDSSKHTTSKHKRSCLDYGRLFYLRHKGNPGYLLKRLGVLLLLVLVGVAYKINDNNRMPMSMHGMPHHSQHRNDKNGMMRAASPQNAYGTTTTNNNNGNGPLLLYQDLPTIVMSKKASSKDGKHFIKDLMFRPPHYKTKPRVMGFILIPTPDGTVVNYNIDRRHHQQLVDLSSQQNRNMAAPPKPVHPFVAEEFHVVQIHPKEKTVIRGNPNTHWLFATHQVTPLGTGTLRQTAIRDSSKDYTKYQPDAVPDGCVPQYDWQSKQFPNCNLVHETDLLTRARTLNPKDEPESILLARGGYRDVWLVEDNDNAVVDVDVGELIAMKTLLYEHPWTTRNMDRHRRDSLATDRLSRSPNALDLYGYCANTGLFEFANGGSLEDAVDDKDDEETDVTIWSTWNSTTKMKYAYQVAIAIADVHNIDHEGLASMSHTDISMSQFVSVNGGLDFKINDFNRARFLYRKENTNPIELCEFEVGSNKGKFRSPEEYAYKGETEKIDIYSMGNIFFVLLTGEYPFAELGKDEAKEAIMKGDRAEIDDQYASSSDPLIQAMIKAIRMCWIQEPTKRATSRVVEQYLRPFAMGDRSQPHHQQHKKEHQHKHQHKHK